MLLSMIFIDIPDSQQRQRKSLMMSPAQCRAARALLSWTQGHLAEVAGLGVSTVADFELERREVSPGAAQAIKEALERGGIIFVEENGQGEGVRRRKK